MVFTLPRRTGLQKNKLDHLWQTSLFKTLAHKHKTSVANEEPDDMNVSRPLLKPSGRGDPVA
jgi:hypothetical protein